MTSQANTISESPAANLKAVLDRIEAAQRHAIAPAGRIELVAVTKGHGRETIAPVLESGHRIFGENRVQEAAAKWPELRARFPGVELHLIGPLQTNKVREAVATFDAIHSLDRPKLADALKGELDKAGKSLPLFIQVNTGEESQKSGVLPKEAVTFVRHCRDALGLRIVGLMCIPPMAEEAALHFALLQKIARESGLKALSMGMSHDFETAIRFGATHVRVGTAIFGERRL